MGCEASSSGRMANFTAISSGSTMIEFHSSSPRAKKTREERDGISRNGDSDGDFGEGDGGGDGDGAWARTMAVLGVSGSGS